MYQQVAPVEIYVKSTQQQKQQNTTYLPLLLLLLLLIFIPMIKCAISVAVSVGGHRSVGGQYRPQENAGIHQCSACCLQLHWRLFR